MYISGFLLGTLKPVYYFHQVILQPVRLTVGAPQTARVHIPAPPHTTVKRSCVRTQSLPFLQPENGIDKQGLLHRTVERNELKPVEFSEECGTQTQCFIKCPL